MVAIELRYLMFLLFAPAAAAVVVDVRMKMQTANRNTDKHTHRTATDISAISFPQTLSAHVTHSDGARAK